MELKWSIKWHWDQFSLRAWKTICRPCALAHPPKHTHPCTRIHAHTHTCTHAHTQARQLLVISWLNFFMNFKTLVVKSRLITSNEEFWTLAGSDGLPRADQVVDGFDSVHLKSLFHVLSLIVSQIESDLRNPNFRFFFVRPEMLKMKILSTKQNLTFYGHKTFFPDVGWRIKIEKVATIIIVVGSSTLKAKFDLMDTWRRKKHYHDV